MGEQDEKENPPSEAQPESEEPKETDKMLEKKDEKTETKTLETTPADDTNKKASSEKIAEDKKKEANGEEIINIPDAENVPKPVTQEGREVKPKKIPIGGIKMPGFFTKGKPRGEGDGADGELLEKEGKDNKLNEEKPKENEKRPGIGERIVNFFKRKQPPKPDEETKEVKTDASADNQDPPPKKGLLNAIKLPIANMIPKKKTDNADDVELGNGPGTKAGLASMETLDDSLKDQDTVDRASKIPDDTLETVKLSDEKKEKEEEELQNISFIDRIRTYKCSIDDLAIVGGIVIFIILLGIICIFAFTGGDPIKSAPVRDGRFIEAITSCGKVEGMKDDGSFAFRGIPYAMPPIGPLRFLPAQPIENIDSCWNGTFKAHNSTEVCLQILANGTIVGTEDCLTLDVITPHVRYDNPLPVVVLIGAESLTGGSPGILRPSARYARAKDVIFVRPNFRMGPFGFLALDALTQSAYPPSSGNYALSDIIAALVWVKTNIAHFGGDAKSVTLFGHRAGGTLVSALITTSQVKDLYTRAWVSSPGAIFPGMPLSDSTRINYEYMNQIQCSTAECLRNATAEQILDAVPDTWRYFPPDLPNINENASAHHQWLVLDGNILKQHPQEVWNVEEGPPKLVIGATAHESHSEKLYLRYNEWTSEVFRQHIENSKIGSLGLTDEVMKRYNATYQGLVAMISDIRTICPLLTTARLQPSAPFYVVTQVDNKLGIADVDADVQAILGRYEPHTPEQRRYVSSMQQLFYHYVSHGEMKQYESRRRILDVGQDALPVDEYPNCDFWISKDIVPRYGRVD